MARHNRVEVVRKGVAKILDLAIGGSCNGVGGRG